MENRTVYCTQCGTMISCEADREFVFCTKCGHKNILMPVQPDVPAEQNEYQPAPPEPLTASPVPVQQVQPAPAAQTLPVPAAPVMPVSAQRPVYQPAAVEPKADLSLAIACYNRGDFETAEKCISLLFENEAENSGVWFCACKVLAAKKPENVEQTAVNFINYAAECLRLSGDSIEARGQLTIEFNYLLKNLVDSMLNRQLYFTPYDNNSMSENFPSVRYQPLQKADEYHQFFSDCVCGFRNNVNPNYRDDYFNQLWNDAFYCIAHVLSRKLADDMNSSRMFYWYKSELSARTPGNNAYRALCDFIYGYRNTFFIMFDRVPFRDARTTIVNRIAYLDKWLLKMKYMDSRGVYVLHVADPRQRLGFEQEIRNYKLMLSRS